MCKNRLEDKQEETLVLKSKEKVFSLHTKGVRAKGFVEKYHTGSFMFFDGKIRLFFSNYNLLDGYLKKYDLYLEQTEREGFK